MKMAGQSGAHSFHGMFGSDECVTADNLPQEYKSGWYFSRKEIENNSPSRKDGIDLRKETQLRILYCSFLQDVGMRLGVSQVTIAAAMVFCHRFYLHQSHARNDWQTIATVCIFLASKVEDTPILLDKVILVAYEMIHRRDPGAPQRIRQKDVFEKQKALILIGERLVLSTIRFDFNIQHPYKPLIRAMNKFGMTQKDMRQMAWNFVNDWLRTTLCLQYKPHYIAAGSLFITAKLHNVKLPSERGYVWWHEFDVTPQQLDAVIREMMELLGHKRRSVATHAPQKPAPAKTPLPLKEEASCSPDSCVLSRPGSDHSFSSQDHGGEVGGSRPVSSIDHSSSICCSLDGKHACVTGSIDPLQRQARDDENPDGVVDDGEISRNVLDQGRMQPDQVQEGLGKINFEKIKELIKRKKMVQEISKRTVALDDGSEDAWIERELEAGIELAVESSNKKKQKMS